MMKIQNCGKDADVLNTRLVCVRVLSLLQSKMCLLVEDQQLSGIHRRGRSNIFTQIANGVESDYEIAKQ